MAATAPVVLAERVADDNASKRSRRGSEARRARRLPSVAAVVGALVALGGMAIGLAPLADNSFLTHLATGRLILEGGIPTADPYSFSAPGQPWVVQSWLASVLYAVAEELGGGAGIRVLMGLTTAAVATLVWRLTRPARSLVPRAAVAGVVLLIGTGVWSERPLLVGLVGLGLVLLAAEDGLDPRWLVPVLWVWANAHGSFPLGLVALVVLAAGRRLDGSHPRVELAALGWAVVGTLAAVIGPLGPQLLTFPIELLARQEVLSEVVEWQAPTFESSAERLFLGQVVVAVVLVVRRPRFRVALPLVVFTAAALLGARNVAVASVVLVPGMAASVAGWGAVDGARRSLANVAAIGAVALVAVGTLGGLRGEPHYHLDRYPVAAVAWLDDEDLLGSGTRLVSRDFAGNYLEWRRGADAHVFIDDRVDMYPTEVVEDYLTLLRGREGWDEVLDRYRADAVLWDRDLALGQLLAESPDWRVAYADDDWLVAIPAS